MTHRKIILGFCRLVLLPCFVGACSQYHEPATTQPNTTIPLKVWVVVGVGESVGNTGNKGCRLAIDEIQTRISQLQAHASIFGPNASFIWTDGTPTQITDNAILPFSPLRGTRNPAQFYQSVVLNYWEEDHINVYFVGNVQTISSNLALALTLDPAGAQLANPPVPSIIMNDGGFLLQSGCLATACPVDVLSYHTSEHEMCHYLARFDGRTFGFGQSPNTRVYDNNEHVPPQSNNVLSEGAILIHPLVVPGQWNQSGTEAKEIWDRISAGNWNNP